MLPHSPRCLAVAVRWWRVARRLPGWQVKPRAAAWRPRHGNPSGRVCLPTCPRHHSVVDGRPLPPSSLACAQTAPGAGHAEALDRLPGHFAWLFRAFLLVSAVTLIAAIGLLRRHEWARRLFIGLMGFAIAYQLLGLVWQWWFMGSMPGFMQASGAPADMAAMMHGFIRAIQVFSALMALGLCVLFGWILRRLCSTQVREEFRPWKASP